MHALATSKRGRNVITFTVFLAVSTAFWFITALNNEVQKEFEIPLRINNIPNNVMMLSNVPLTLSVDIKDKGTSLLRWEWGKLPLLEIDYSQFQNNGRYISMNNTLLTGLVRSAFGGATNIVEVKPDSLSLSYTTHQGVKKKIDIVADISVSPQHTLSGQLRLSTDTVRVYSAGNIPADLHIRTDSVQLSALTDTTYIDVQLISPPGMKVIPETVRLMVPVEPLIVRRRSIPVQVVGEPDDVRVLTFPSTVEVSYTVPMSIYNHDTFDIAAYANYSAKGRKLPLTLSKMPASYRNVTLATDSVEFLVEHR